MPLKLIDLLVNDVPEVDLLGSPYLIPGNVLPSEDTALFDVVRRLRSSGVEERLIRDAACIAVQYAKELANVYEPVEGVRVLEKILRVPAAEVLNVCRDELLNLAIGSADLSIHDDAVRMVFNTVYNAFEGNLFCETKDMFSWIDEEVIHNLHEVVNSEEVAMLYPMLSTFVEKDVRSLDILYRLCDEYLLMDLKAGVKGDMLEVPLFNNMPELEEVEPIEALECVGQLDKFFPIFLERAPTKDQQARFCDHRTFLTKDKAIAEAWFPYFCAIKYKGVCLYLTMAGLFEGVGKSMGEGFYQPYIRKELLAVYRAGKMMPGAEFLLSKTMRRGFVNSMQFRGLINRMATTNLKPAMTPLKLELSKVQQLTNIKDVMQSILGSRGLNGHEYFKSAGQTTWSDWYLSFSGSQRQRNKPNKIVRAFLLKTECTAEMLVAHVRDAYSVSEEEAQCIVAFSYMALSGALEYKDGKIKLIQ